MSEAAISDAMEATRVFLNSASERRAYVNRQIEIMDYNSLKSSARNEGLAEGLLKGRLSALANSVKMLMQNMHLTSAEALDALGVAASDREQIIKEL